MTFIAWLFTVVKIPEHCGHSCTNLIECDNSIQRSTVIVWLPPSLHHSYLMPHHSTGHNNQQPAHSYATIHLWWQTPSFQHQLCYLIESNELFMLIQVLINPMYIDCELFLVLWTVSAFIYQDAKTVAASNVATYSQRIYSAMSCRHSFWVSSEVYLFVVFFNHESIPTWSAPL